MANHKTADMHFRIEQGRRRERQEEILQKMQKAAACIEHTGPLYTVGYTHRFRDFTSSNQLRAEAEAFEEGWKRMSAESLQDMYEADMRGAAQPISKEPKLKDLGKFDHTKEGAPPSKPEIKLLPEK